MWQQAPFAFGTTLSSSPEVIMEEATVSKVERPNLFEWQAQAKKQNTVSKMSRLRAGATGLLQAVRDAKEQVRTDTAGIAEVWARWAKVFASKEIDGEAL